MFPIWVFGFRQKDKRFFGFGIRSGFWFFLFAVQLKLGNVSPVFRKSLHADSTCVRRMLRCIRTNSLIHELVRIQL